MMDYRQEYLSIARDKDRKTLPVKWALPSPHDDHEVLYSETADYNVKTIRRC